VNVPVSRPFFGRLDGILGITSMPMMPRHRSLLALLAAALGVGLFACGRATMRSSTAGGAPEAQVEPVILSAPDTRYDGTVRIASIFPTIGRYALSGIQSANGARMAIEDLNRRGGIHGRKLKLLEYRTGSYFVDARQAAEKAVLEGGVLALVGSNSSSLSTPVAEVAEARHVVQVSNISTAEDLTWNPATGRERLNVFRVCGSDVVMGELLARFAAQELRARRAAVLYEVGRAYSALLAQSFIRAFRSAEAGRAAAEFFYLPLEIDFRPQLQQIQGFAPDVLFVPGDFTDATLVAGQAAALEVDAPLLGGDAWSNRLLFKRGHPAGPAFYADLCSPPAAFGERYRKQFGEDAEGCRAVLAYDAVLSVAEALKAVGPLSDRDLTADVAATRSRLRAALERVDFEGRTGRIRFDRHRNREGGMAIMEVVATSGGRFVPRPQGSLHVG
jgi:branched-chain amino acid transport system substrate-binding protein